MAHSLKPWATSNFVEIGLVQHSPSLQDRETHQEHELVTSCPAEDWRLFGCFDERESKPNGLNVCLAFPGW